LVKPDRDEDLAFLPVVRLSELIRTRQVSSVELTRLYLERLHQFDRVLNCVVTFTDDLALRQAQRADDEIASGKYRGPLHGVHGCEDLNSIPVTRQRGERSRLRPSTRWQGDGCGRWIGGQSPARCRSAVAWGDGWFRGQTHILGFGHRISGSSAGSAARPSRQWALLWVVKHWELISPCR
jgi:hypothetical protein